MRTLQKDNQKAAEELVERGQRLYKKFLSELLEPSHAGRYVAIEPLSGKFFLGDTGTEALLEASKTLPKALFYLTRVGHPVADTFSSYGRRIG